MTLLYRTLADVTVVVHFAFLAFVVLGGLLVLRRPHVALVHAPAAAWGVVIELTGWVCPLTPLENHFRRLGGQEPYSGGFIARYIVDVLYPTDLTRGMQVAFGVGVLVLNAFLYWRAFGHARPRRST